MRPFWRRTAGDHAGGLIAGQRLEAPAERGVGLAALRGGGNRVCLRGLLAVRWAVAFAAAASGLPPSTMRIRSGVIWFAIRSGSPEPEPPKNPFAAANSSRLTNSSTNAIARRIFMSLTRCSCAN